LPLSLGNTHKMRLVGNLLEDINVYETVIDEYNTDQWDAQSQGLARDRLRRQTFEQKARNANLHRLRTHAAQAACCWGLFWGCVLPSAVTQTWEADGVEHGSMSQSYV
jgi:hypothetical protein